MGVVQALAGCGERCCRRHADQTGVAIFVGAVAGAHLLGVCAYVEYLRKMYSWTPNHGLDRGQRKMLVDSVR